MPATLFGILVALLLAEPVALPPTDIASDLALSAGGGTSDSPCLPGLWTRAVEEFPRCPTTFMTLPIAAGNETGSDEIARLEGGLTATVWEWQDFRGGDGEVLSPLAPEQYTVTFLDDGTLAIQAECNRTSGTYSVDGSRIEIDVEPEFGIRCAVSPLASRFLVDLEQVSSFVTWGGSLYLALPMDAGIMSFSPRHAAITAKTRVSVH